MKRNPLECKFLIKDLIEVSFPPLLEGHSFDEGSGAATLLETARVLLASKMEFKRPVYIIWYAAGNRDFAGSRYVIQHFEENSIQVKAAVQFDKTGYRFNAADPTIMWNIWLISPN